MIGFILTWLVIGTTVTCIVWGKKIIRDAINDAEAAGRQELKILACGLIEQAMQAKAAEGDAVVAGALRSCGKLIWTEQWGHDPEFFKNATRRGDMHG